MIWILIVLSAIAFLFCYLLLCLTWTHKPVSLWEIIKELLFGSGKEKK